MKQNKEMSDLTASLITAGGIGAMLLIAGLPMLPTAILGGFTIGGLVGINLGKKSK